MDYVLAVRIIAREGGVKQLGIKNVFLANYLGLSRSWGVFFFGQGDRHLVLLPARLPSFIFLLGSSGSAACAFQDTLGSTSDFDFTLFFLPYQQSHS